MSGRNSTLLHQPDRGVVRVGVESQPQLGVAVPGDQVRPGDPRFHAFTLMGPMLMGIIFREVLQPAGGAPVDIEALARQHAETVLAGLLVEEAR